MSRRRPTTEERAAQVAARLEIIQAANRYIIGIRRLRSVFGHARLFGSRQLQQAVCVARRHHLVDDEILVAAGFRPARRRPQPLEVRKAA